MLFGAGFGRVIGKGENGGIPSGCVLSSPFSWVLLWAAAGGRGSSGGRPGDRRRVRIQARPYSSASEEERGRLGLVWGAAGAGADWVSIGRAAFSW